MLALSIVKMHKNQQKVYNNICCNNEVSSDVNDLRERPYAWCYDDHYDVTKLARYKLYFHYCSWRLPLLQVSVLVHRRTVDQFFPPTLPYVDLLYYKYCFPSLPPSSTLIFYPLKYCVSRTLPYVECCLLFLRETWFFVTNMINPPPPDSSSGDIFYPRNNEV